ncbi:MAG: alpha/beta hydrolase [Clostridia bacterium]
MELTIRDCRIFVRYHLKDNGTGPAILLLHGWGCDGSIFSFIESELSQNASTLSLDFPGHGQSDEPPEPWGVSDYAEQVFLLLQELSIPKVKIIAHSFGGRVAIYLAALHPEAVDQLVITGGAGIRKPATKSQQRRQKQFKQMSAILTVLGNIRPLSAMVNEWQSALRKQFGSADYNKLDENMRRTFVKVISEDLLPMLSSILAPTLLVWGSDDTETPLWMGEQMEQSIPDAGLVIFEGRSHFAFIEEWQRFTLIVKQFFKGGEEA